MECRICPGCGKKVFSADCSHTWECPYDDCDFPVITVDCLVNIMLSEEQN